MALSNVWNHNKIAMSFLLITAISLCIIALIINTMDLVRYKKVINIVLIIESVAFFISFIAIILYYLNNDGVSRLPGKYKKQLEAYVEYLESKGGKPIDLKNPCEGVGPPGMNSQGSQGFIPQGSYNQVPYNQGPYNQGPYNQAPYNQGSGINVIYPQN